MSALTNKQIPRLTDAVSEEKQSGEQTAEQPSEQSGALEALAGDRDVDALIAELQTAIAARTFQLTDELMRKAFAEMEARVFRQISSSLRSELPELIDDLIRAQLGKQEDDGDGGGDGGGEAKP